MIRVAYVLPGDPGGRDADQLLALLPTVGRTVAALHATGEAQVTIIARVGSSWGANDASLQRQFVADGRAWPARLAVAARAAKPDVVHLNGLVFPVTALALRTVVGQPVVAQHHGELVPGGRSLALHRLANRTVAAHLFTGADHGQAGPWRALGVRRACEVLEASADPPEGGTAPESRDGGRRIVWVGRLVPGKDPIAAVDAFATLRSQQPDAELTMVCGDRQMEPAVRARLGHHGLGDVVELVGPVPHAAMAGWYRWADIFLSTSHHEGSGYALLEALAAGCTPVVSALPSHRSIAGALGSYFTPGDVGAAAAALTGALVERQRIRADFETRLSWAAVADQLLAAYRSVL